MCRQTPQLGELVRGFGCCGFISSFTQSFRCRKPVNKLGVLSLSFQLQKMKEKKGLYPDKSVYTQQIGPGFCFGALALMLRFFFEVPLCTLHHPDFTRCKGRYQERRPPALHRWAAPGFAQNPARVSGSGAGSRDKGSHP